MQTTTLNAEEVALKKAVQEFSKLMLRRLLDKYRFYGFEGWESPEGYPEWRLRRELVRDASRKTPHRKAVDIANRAMFLWYRRFRRQDRELRRMLSLVDVYVTLKVIKRLWTDVDCEQAWAWATAVHLKASDNIVHIPPVPPCIKRLKR